MNEEKQFTLTEAKREIQRRECAAHGHDLDIFTRMGEPVMASCRCGGRWVITRDEPATLPSVED